MFPPWGGLLVLLSSKLPQSTPPSFISLSLVSGQVLGVFLVHRVGCCFFSGSIETPPQAPWFFLDLVSALVVYFPCLFLPISVFYAIFKHPGLACPRLTLLSLQLSLQGFLSCSGPDLQRPSLDTSSPKYASPATLPGMRAISHPQLTQPCA